jgi:TonB family protein
MRNRLRFRPDPFDYSLLGGIHRELPGKDPGAQGDGTSLSRLASALPVGDGASSADLALDLVLNEIAEQARLATAATGVAIALARSGELVCRAATGSAPDLGARLNPYSGLSGLCMQTQYPQSCDDTEIDPRVEVAACRNLRVRSILVAPIRKKEEVVGLLEAFSAEPNHFREHDIKTLESFCQQVVNNIDHAAEASAILKTRVASAVQETVSADSEGVNAAVPREAHRPRDGWTFFLAGAVIVTALFLGWMLGRTDKRRVSIAKPAHSDAKSEQSSRNEAGHGESIANQLPANRVTNENGLVPQTIGEKYRVKKLVPGLAESKNTTDTNSDGGLVVYQNGRVLFRETPRQRPQSGKDIAAASEARPGRIVPAGKTTHLTQEAANDYLAYRVEPLYPELARQEHVQGPVLLKVMVGTDGGVQQVQVLSGDPKLSAAAADAVVQWRFKPLLRSGQPVEFETEVTVDFRLP